MKLVEVEALVEAGELQKAVRLLQDMPVDAIPCERIRPWIFHPDDDLRQLAVRLLGQKCDTDSIVDLACLFEAGLDFHDHDFIFEAYVAMGEPGVPGLLAVVKNGTPGQRSAALQGLGQMGGPAVPFLVELLEAGEADELLFVAFQNSHDARALPALLSHLAGHPNDEEAAYALEACIGEGCGMHIPAMVRILRRSRRVEVRRSILQAIGGTRDPAAIVPLLGHLKDPEAAEALGEIGHPDAVVALANALKSPLPSESLDAVLSAILTNPLSGDELRREAARICLSRRDLPDALALVADEPACRCELDRVALSQDPLQRFLLATALPKEEAAPHYEFVLRCGDPSLLRELATGGDRLPEGLVTQLVHHHDVGLRWRLARSMQFRQKSLPLLTELLKDKQSKVREEATLALEQIAEAFVLLAELHNDRSRKVRSAAAGVIRRLEGVEIEERIPVLARFLYDRAGRPTDLSLGMLYPFDGSEVRPRMLSEAIAWLEHPLAIQLLGEWKARGGDSSTVGDRGD